MGTGEFSPGVKRPGREADRSPPFTSKVKNLWSYTSTPYIFMSWCLVKQKENFVFTLPYLSFKFCPLLTLVGSSVLIGSIDLKVSCKK
jgi:hypothetical protein